MILALLGLLQYIVGTLDAVTVVFLVFLVVVWLAIYPRLIRQRIRGSANRLIREGRNASLIGDHELEVTESRLVNHAPKSESTFDWSAVEKVVETPGHLIIYVSAVNALIIGRQKMAEPEQFPELVRLVRQYSEAARES